LVVGRRLRPDCLVAYAPALRGAFVFDDGYLPFLLPQYENAPLADWIREERPLLMFSFWLNYQSGGLAPGGYHAVNLVCHVLVWALITLILARLLDWAGVSGTRRVALSLFGGGLCLLHPLQTESVSYVASRSETLGTLLYLVAYAMFLLRPPGPLSWSPNGPASQPLRSPVRVDDGSRFLLRALAG
jgi:hypothetical protein